MSFPFCLITHYRFAAVLAVSYIGPACAVKVSSVLAVNRHRGTHVRGKGVFFRFYRFSQDPSHERIAQVALDVQKPQDEANDKTDEEQNQRDHKDNDNCGDDESDDEGQQQSGAEDDADGCHWLRIFSEEIREDEERRDLRADERCKQKIDEVAERRIVHPAFQIHFRAFNGGANYHEVDLREGEGAEHHKQCGIALGKFQGVVYAEIDEVYGHERKDELGQYIVCERTLIIPITTTHMPQDFWGKELLKVKRRGSKICQEY